MAIVWDYLGILRQELFRQMSFESFKERIKKGEKW